MTRTALSNGLGCCPRCQKINKMQSEKQQCSRCAHWFYSRKPNSLQHTLAWTVTSLVLFIPANIYPMMTLHTFGKTEASTILQGIATFIQTGHYPIAFIIFIASFIIPLGKIIGLFFLVYHVKHRSNMSLKRQSHLFHIVENIGPWSMLDVFVVVVMASVVNLGFISNIEVSLGASYFALMVIATLMAAHSFDSRLLWDNNNNKEQTHE
ncbi:paraquat-inducible protein A [Thalassotalea sp. 1_MG-2023]|uniref:paraquat-inducible protein A n=1 Tax=Thalassotalea sp. 1_MG-2023 TaxID=3062680 RepID=UPI0026E263FC|nr:paraquat-inducible protein A [Thalassotalea sp. 1_MG-2023]MDO6426050.1 paraquat-inducible protein A [Thalassotalea sp. 1_MG-2023]